MNRICQDSCILLAVIAVFLIVFGVSNSRYENSRERARRVACKHNLLSIQKYFDEKNLDLIPDNLEKITDALSKIELRCPSGAYLDGGEPIYKIKVVGNDIFVTESMKNHDQERLEHVTLPAVYYELRNGQVYEIATNARKHTE